jgi:hypothetical protein
MKKFIVLCLLIKGVLYAQPPIVDGWTVFTPSADSRIIYVSATSGNDATAQTYQPNAPAIGGNIFQPTGAIQPYASLAAAKTQLRSGYPDYLLLKSGDTWTNQTFGTMEISGRNLNELMLIGSYGTGARPRILTADATGIQLTSPDCSHIAIVDLYLTPNTLGPGDEPAGIVTFSPFEQIIIENCYITAFPTAITAHGNTGIRRDLTIRRSMITYSAPYGNLASQPVFLDNINGILVEECLFDHNGWNTAIGSLPSAFKHNTYFQVDNSNVVFRKNIVARASAMGIGMRCGGTVQDNLVLENVNNLQFGTAETTINWPSESVSGSIIGNVIIGARNTSFDPGRAIFIAKASDVLVQHNIIKDYTPAAMSDAIIASDGYANLNIRQNIIYNWCPNIPFGPGTFFETNNGIFLAGGGTGTNIITQNHIQQFNPGGGCIRSTTWADKQFSQNRYINPTPNNSFQSGNINYTNWLTQSGETGSTYGAQTYTDPNRDISTYLTTLGASGGLDEFLTAASNLTKQDWNTNFTALPVIEYIRAGFDVTLPVTQLVLTGQPHLNHVRLQWQTESERNTTYFDIQHSTNGVRFEQIGSVAAAGHSTSTQHYDFEHDNASTGQNYYRIRQVDMDGKYAYSRMIMVRLGTENIRVWPNPGRGFFNVEMSDRAPDLIYRVWTPQGQLVHQGSVQQSIINLHSLEKGVYWVEFWQHNGQSTLHHIQTCRVVKAD